MNRAEAGRLGAKASIEITQRLKNARIAKYNENPKRCQYCGTPFVYERRYLRFCNHSCAAKYNNPFSHVKKDKVQNICLQCGKPTYNIKFCSMKCSTEYNWNIRKQKIENNEVKFNIRAYRKYFIEKYGHTCKLCGITEWQGQPVPLVMDHIDGNSDNNDLSNLRMICHNCDALLPTFAGRNKNSARKYRRDMYRRKYC